MVVEQLQFLKHQVDICIWQLVRHFPFSPHLNHLVVHASSDYSRVITLHGLWSKYSLQPVNQDALEAVLLHPSLAVLSLDLEAADVSLGCILTPNSQWWPFGLVRSKTWAPSTHWEQIKPSNPFVVGTHVGCTLQYNSFWTDKDIVYWAYWSLNIEDGQVKCQTWYLFKLGWGTRPKLPIHAPRPTC